MIYYVMEKKSINFLYISDEVQHGFPHFHSTTEPTIFQNIVAKSLLKGFKGREMIDVSKHHYKFIKFRRKISSFLWRKMLPYLSRTLANEANIGRKLMKLLNKNRDTRQPASVIHFPSDSRTVSRKKKMQSDEDDDEDDNNDTLENKGYHSKSSGKPSFDSIFG